MDKVYYNEIDPFAAQWLRELIKAGHIADGVVDERSIEDVVPTELVGFKQCHLFAGIGVWSYALRRSGWADDRQVWTGSCPCQPFSVAGKGGGIADERHLWPAFSWLIAQCRPVVVFGEQVAGRAGEAWFDIVRTDLEAEGYAAGVSVFPSCGVGAPHLRKRLYWVADAAMRGREKQPYERSSELFGAVLPSERIRDQPSSLGAISIGMADTDSAGLEGRQQSGKRDDAQRTATERDDKADSMADAAGPTNGQWRDADWLYCRDDKWRPVEPGTFPLANGAAARVGRLRGYGNAIVAQQAQAWIESYLGINREVECLV